MENAETALREARKRRITMEGYSVFNDGNYVYIPVGDSDVADFPVVDVEGRRNRRPETPQRTSGSFDVIGEIAIIKARDLDKAHRIASAIMARKGSIKSVYMDTGISGEYRLRNLVLVSGPEMRSTIHRENGVVLKVDLEKVYFSPRLATERLLLSGRVKDGERILDMFCGVGPFAITIARKRSAEIMAVDKNPSAIELLEENIRMNRLKGHITAAACDALSYAGKLSGMDRIIMNLPESSGEFLGAAIGAARKGGVINYYENLEVGNLGKRMREIMDLGLEIKAKREVHSLSRSERMYSLELIVS